MLIIIIRSQKLLPRWGRIALNTPDDRSPTHMESAALHQLLSAEVEYKAQSEISCSVSTDANDRSASFNYTKSFQPCFLWDTYQCDQLLYPGSLCKCCFFPKVFSSMSSMTQQQSCFTEITNCKLFTKMKGSVEGSRRKCRLYHSVLERCWKFLQAVWLFKLESNFLSLIHTIN